MATTSSIWMNLPNVLLGHKVQDSIKHSRNDSYARLQSVRVYEEIAWWRMCLYSNLGTHTHYQLSKASPPPPQYYTPFSSSPAGKAKKINAFFFPCIPEMLMVAAAFAAPKVLLCLFEARQVNRPGRVTYTCSLESTTLSLTLSAIDPTET